MIIRFEWHEVDKKNESKFGLAKLISRDSWIIDW